MKNKSQKRVRDLGIIIGNLPVGKFNAITDVDGVKAGHSTIIKGNGKLCPGKGPIRTGVTAILPHSRNIFKEKIRGGVCIFNGFGKSVGLIQVDELGEIETPILITNTLNVWRVADCLVEWMLEQNKEIGVTEGTINPIVCECSDAFLNDIRGRHVNKKNVFKALSDAKDGVVEEGNVGAGTGMSSFGYKSGVGTSSRIIKVDSGQYTIGCLVVSNFGRAGDLQLKGINISKLLNERTKEEEKIIRESFIAILATDAPFSTLSLERLAKRSALALGKVGSYSDNYSGDIFICFSTAKRTFSFGQENKHINKFFQGVVETVEESILNSIFMAETLIGRDNHIKKALPVEEVLNILKRKADL